MLDSLHIQNYRLFKDLKIEKLGQVNLIAGKNNTGKTALLEVIRIMVSNPYLIAQIIASRGSTIYDDIFYETIFYNKNVDNQIEIVLKSDRSTNTLKVRKNKKNNIEFSSKEFPYTDGIIEFTESFKLQEGFTYNPFYLIVNKNFIFIPIFFDDINVYNALWKDIPLTPKIKEVVDILNIIDKKIIDVAFDNGLVKALLNGEESPVYLKSLGDGANRFFQIALALVKAKETKLLLIDEFEVGLHHSVQKQLWDIIFKYAKEWNIQVFVTTHSLDTIENFYYIAYREENRDLGNYFILNRHKEITKAVYFDLSDMKLALETNLEMR